MKVLNGNKLILDDHGNNLDLFRISLKSFRGPLFLKPGTGQELVFAVSLNEMCYLLIKCYHIHATIQFLTFMGVLLIGTCFCLELYGKYNSFF